MKKKNKKILFVILGIVVLLGILWASGIFKGSNNTLSILGQSTVTVNDGADGKTYWLITGTAENLDSGYVFSSLPPVHARTDGSTVTPQARLTLNIKTKEKSCSYQLLPKQTTYYCFSVLGVCVYSFQYNYKVLYNPERTFLIDVSANKGSPVVLDGSMESSRDIQDPDGSGKVTISTVGAFSTKQDCPESSDIAVIGSGTNNKLVSKSQLETDLNNIGTNTHWYTLLWNALTGGSSVTDLIFSNYPEQVTFTSAFSSYPIITDSSVKGGKNVGNPVFTITADQGFYNSVVYRPPTSSDPYIDSSSIQGKDIQSGTTGTFNVVVKNRIATAGNVELGVSGTYSTISPSNQNFVLPGSGSSTKTFQITENVFSQTTSESITVQVCTNNQFGANKCDSKTFTHNIIPGKPEHYCGDGICNTDEDSANCPSDCHYPTNCSKEAEVCVSDTSCCKGLNCVSGKCQAPIGECKSCIAWASNIFKPDNKCTPKGTEVKWYNPLSWFNATGLFSQNLWCPILLGSVAIVFIFSMLFGLDFLDRFRAINGKKKIWVKIAIALIIASILSYITYVAFVLGVILFILFLIVKFAIGFILPTKYLSMLKRKDEKK